MSRSSLLGRYTQFTRGKEICILLANDDYICRNIVSYMLGHCHYEVFSYGREMDVLNIIREKKDELELILTNIHRTNVKRYGIIEYIENKFKLQIILMSPDVDNMNNVSRGGRNGVTVYLMKSLSSNELNNLWATALAREKGKRELSSGKLVCVENVSSLVVPCETRKRTITIDDQNGNIEKKPRVVWTKEMHQKFLEAIAQLGDDKAFPKKIVEQMNVPGLTRENVASHLQKYRMCMKRAQEGFAGSSYESTDPYGFNIRQEQFQQSSCLNAFRMRSITNHFGNGLDLCESSVRMPPNISILNTLQLKPEQNFKVYDDEKKDVLPLNTSFAGFRLASDGNSVEFGQNNDFDGVQMRKVNNSCPSASLDQQKCLLPEMGNDNFSHFLSFPELTDTDEVTSFTQLQSAAPMIEWTGPTSFSPQVPPSENYANSNTEIFSDFTSTSFPPELCELGMIEDDDDGFDTTAIGAFDDLLFDRQDLT